MLKDIVLDLNEIIGYIGSTIAVYIGTVYFSRIPVNKGVYKASLKNVYTPLMIIFDNCERELIKCNYNYDEAKNKISLIINEEKDCIKDIVNNNYALFSLDLPVKLENLLENLQNNEIQEKDIKNIIRLIKTDYEEIKTKLGYPCTSLSYCFIKEDLQGKVKIANKVVFKFANFFLIFLIIVISTLTIFSVFNLKNIIFFIVTLILIVIAIFIINKNRI